MHSDISIPSVGESITSGVISEWRKNDGDLVKSGDELFLLETDKVTNTIQADRGGILKITVPAGTEVKIGQVVGRIEESASGASPASAPAATPTPAAAEAPVSAPPPVSTPTAQPEVAKPLPPAPAVAHPPESAATPSPVAAANVALSVISENAPPVISSGETRVTRRKMSMLRKKIAAQLVSAQRTAAILTTFNEADMSGVMKMRSELQDSFTKEHGIKLGFMSFFIKATVSALKAVPQVNVRVEGDEIVENHFYDIGVAVGTEKGLIVPVIRDADRKSFADLERDLVSYAVRGREGKIKMDDLQGGVFTISNGGTYGSLLSTPILNPPQSGILGMHKIQERPIAVNGQVVIRPMMYLALSYDHRVVDGKEAVTFLVRLKESIEQPARLLLGL